MVGRIVCKRRLNLETCEYEEAPEFFVDGKRVSEDEYKAAFPDKPMGVFGSGWHKGTKVISDSFAVLPEQVAEFTEDAKKLGVPTDFQPTGEPIFNSTNHKRRYCKAYHMRERNAYY